jgi:hypothetical protein
VRTSHICLIYTCSVCLVNSGLSLSIAYNKSLHFDRFWMHVSRALARSTRPRQILGSTSARPPDQPRADHAKAQLMGSRLGSRNCQNAVNVCGMFLGQKAGECQNKRHLDCLNSLVLWPNSSKSKISFYRR